MKTLELNDLCLSELNPSELSNIDGGIVLGFNWGVFGKWCRIGIATGAAGATTYYLIA